MALDGLRIHATTIRRDSCVNFPTFSDLRRQVQANFQSWQMAVRHWSEMQFFPRCRASSVRLRLSPPRIAIGVFQLQQWSVRFLRKPKLSDESETEMPIRAFPAIAARSAVGTGDRVPQVAMSTTAGRAHLGSPAVARDGLFSE